MILVRGQRGRPLQEGGAAAPATPAARPVRRPLQLRGHLLVRASGRLGQVPGPPVRINLRIGDRGQRLVRAAPRPGRRSTPPTGSADDGTAPAAPRTPAAPLPQPRPPQDRSPDSGPRSRSARAPRSGRPPPSATASVCRRGARRPAHHGRVRHRADPDDAGGRAPAAARPVGQSGRADRGHRRGQPAGRARGLPGRPVHPGPPAPVGVAEPARGGPRGDRQRAVPGRGRATRPAPGYSAAPAHWGSCWPGVRPWRCSCPASAPRALPAMQAHRRGPRSTVSRAPHAHGRIP